jgi:hypothetical protein
MVEGEGLGEGGFLCRREVEVIGVNDSGVIESPLDLFFCGEAVGLDRG